MYSLTFCVRIMLPERHQWEPAVQATTVMLRTPPVNGQQRAQTPPSQPFALCRHIVGWTQACHYGSRYVAIATQPVHQLQSRPIVHNQGASPTTTPSYIRVCVVVWACGRGQTDTYADRHTDARDHDTFCVVYDSRKM